MRQRPNSAQRRTAKATPATNAKPAATRPGSCLRPWPKPRSTRRWTSLLGERNSQRSIVRATGVSRMSIAKRIKKAQASSPPAAAAAPEKRPEKALGSARTR
ncbi:MAG: hypothetical protein WKG07_11315 [Hymenobacter sp.]